jgi:hypothetical protein
MTKKSNPWFVALTLGLWLTAGPARAQPINWQRTADEALQTLVQYIRINRPLSY